jgi:hypothetical protein
MLNSAITQDVGRQYDIENRDIKLAIFEIPTAF